MNTTTEIDGPSTRAAFRTFKGLIGGYLALSVLTLVAVALLRNHHSMVTTPVWVRTSIVVASSLLMAAFAARAARGSGRAFLRLRLVSAIMVVAIVVIIAIPGSFPAWLKIEQGVCGLLLIGVVVVVNGKHLRSVFAAR
ncbi:hypothetical protein [Kribbella monticola]|uniref:hypothetical protein n=1 Tax=Kribbella monticola TaxID=2185285 RepID=UPI0018E4FA57|nr:hypothetical protein [Kribbella monticola]